MASVVGEFLSGVDMKEAASYPHHHEDKPNTQVSFLKDMKCLIVTMRDMGKVLSDSSEDLLFLDTREVVDASVVDSVRKMGTSVKPNATSSSRATGGACNCT